MIKLRARVFPNMADQPAGCGADRAEKRTLCDAQTALSSTPRVAAVVHDGEVRLLSAISTIHRTPNNRPVPSPERKTSDR